MNENTLIQSIRDVLTIRKLTEELFQKDDPMRDKLNHVTDAYLEALLK